MKMALIDGDEVCDVIAENVSEANAKLIAAAPDLLELLIIATELMFENQSDNLRRMERWYDLAQGAIAKANSENA